MAGGILGDHVLATLLKHKDARGILAAVVHAVAVAADAEIEALREMFTAIGGAASPVPSREERAIAVVDLGILDAIEDDAVLAVGGREVVQRDALSLSTQMPAP